ncbi:MAG TPA: choice-of-anchor Q domain-containing protein, partial [Ktedonobacteraceae bacterium]|nr:choice-of-anchor Q domain-containing protein [Ktedonobacteraceae bacterium]
GNIFNRMDDTTQTFSSIVTQNSLFAGGSASDSPDVAGELTSKGYNLLQDTSGTVFLDPDHQHATDLDGKQFPDLKINPKLQLNEGTTSTHALLPGSPAMNVIPVTDCQSNVNGITITTDQRGIKRPQEAACDIGAYEYRP